jgi:F-type H+-transporting ATPase subunit b
MLKSPEFYVLVAFVIFFVLFGRQLWAAVVKQLDGRADAIRTQLAEAEALRIEAEQMLRNAQAARQAALDEARDIIERGRAEAARIAEAAHAEAEAQAARRERMARDRISSAEKAAVTEVRQTAADIAATAARAVLAETLTADADATLVDHAIASLPRALRAAA